MTDTDRDADAMLGAEILRRYGFSPLDRAIYAVEHGIVAAGNLARRERAEGFRATPKRGRE